MNEEIVYVLRSNSSNCDSLDIRVYNGKVELKDTCLYKITFYSARGGETMLFGKVITDNKPQTQNLVSFFNDTLLINKLSYYDILKLPTRNKDSLTIYVYP